MNAITGEPQKDVLGWALDAGKQNGIKVTAWFEGGLTSGYSYYKNNFTDVALDRNWIAGKGLGYWWLNATHTGV
jgi:hypothetical protein